jgi:hypothetical protein
VLLAGLGFGSYMCGVRVSLDDELHVLGRLSEQRHFASPLPKKVFSQPGKHYSKSSVKTKRNTSSIV